MQDFIVGKGRAPNRILTRLANRHGLIAGATGTGKTVTLQVLAEGFSRCGVPVFMADVKGDLSGMCRPIEPGDRIRKRLEKVEIPDFEPAGFPLVFWDLFGRQGHPVRTTISEMGPVLLARMLELSEAQEGVLNIAFTLADDEGLLLLDLKDLRSMLGLVGERARELTATHGYVSRASIGTIVRRLTVLEAQGAEQFFGEPALALSDLMRCQADGRGTINVLAADRLMASPKLYATFLLWLLAELFEELPEAGDLDRPKLVFFFDEAHVLFDDAPKGLLDQVEQVVRLIRSKGVGIYFVTQQPSDIPDDVLGQLGHKVQHALRAFTPKDQKSIRAAAASFRPHPEVDVERALTELGVGEALVSFLDQSGVPTEVDRSLIRPPSSRIGPATEAERADQRGKSPLGAKYDRGIDRESAFELLSARKERAQSTELEQQTPKRGRARRTPDRAPRRRQAKTRRSRRQSTGEAMVKSAARSFGTRVGRSFARGLLGALKRAL